MWTLHSVWALATGIAVIWLARERYGFVKWVALFIALTWVSTLFFGRRTVDDVGSDPTRPPGLGTELSSYLTRIMYQETLFFLIPFYAYSTVVRSPNVIFLLLIGGLATLSCLDLPFDRLLRSSATFGAIFFGTVAFAALNLLLPLVFEMSPSTSLRAAALGAFASAVPIALRAAGLDLRRVAATVVAAGGLTATAIAFPATVPAVPLRLDTATFAADVDRTTLEPIRDLGESATPAQATPRLALIARVFAPGDLPATVHLDWYRDGRLERTSREIDITAHEDGFRVWDGMPASAGPPAPGDWRVVLRTRSGAIFGVASIRIEDGTT